MHKKPILFPLIVFILCLNFLTLACNDTRTPGSLNNSNQLTIKNYQGVGVITKINPDRRTIEINHDDIEGLMPAMTMEFHVKDRALLETLKPGDKINFTIEEKAGTEVITEIRKAVTSDE
jgi:Cu/Ag efflux protein CusF